MKAVILCGGEGKRVREIAPDRQKVMIDINGKSILQYNIEEIRNQGVKDIILCTGHKHEQIQEYFGDGSKFGVNIKYSQEYQPLGTGGCLALAKNLIDDDFFLLNGDVIFKIDIGLLKTLHKKNQCLVTIVTHETDHPYDSDLIEVNADSTVRRIINKPHKKSEETKLSITGAYYCSRGILDHIPLKKVSFERIILKDLLKENLRVYAYETPHFIIDLGTLDRIERFKKISFHSHNPNRWHKKIWRDYPINYNPSDYYEGCKWWMDKLIPLGNKIMEIGCYSGVALVWLKYHFPEKDIVGIDINPTVIHMAKTRAYYFMLNIPFYLGDAFNLRAYEDKSKNVIFHTGLIEHFENNERVEMLKEHLKVAKNVLIVVPVKSSIEDGKGYGDEKRLTYEEWSEFMNKQFIVKEEFTNNENENYGCILDGVKDG